MTSQQFVRVTQRAQAAASSVPQIDQRGRRSSWTTDLMLASLVFLLNAGDFLLTLTLAPFGGQELNPIFAVPLKRGEWGLVVTLKFLPFIVLMAGVGYLRQHLTRMPRLITWGLRLLLVEYTLLLYFILTQAVILFCLGTRIAR